MRTLIDFSILQEYNQKVLPRGDKLLSIAGLVDWKRFLPIGAQSKNQVISRF